MDVRGFECVRRDFVPIVSYSSAHEYAIAFFFYIYILCVAADTIYIYIDSLTVSDHAKYAVWAKIILKLIFIAELIFLRFFNYKISGTRLFQKVL